MAIGDPTGGDLAVGTTNGSTLPESPSYEEREVSLGAGVALVSGTQYAICVGNSASASADAIAVSGQIFPNANYADGYYADSNDSGSSWSQDDWIDLWFKTKASAVEKDIYTDTGYALTNGYGTTWYSQIFTASSSYTITSVVLRLAQYGGGTPGTITVSIRAVQGAAPTKAENPTPTDAADDVTLDQETITWEDGGGATSYNVYYGDASGDLTLVSEGQEGLSFTVNGVTLGSPYDYIVTRYWRIDSINDDGTTTGDEWSFTTIRFTPPSSTYWYVTGSYYYRLLVDADGDLGDPPPGGVEDVDYIIVAGPPSPDNTPCRLVVAANNTIFYEDV